MRQRLGSGNRLVPTAARTDSFRDALRPFYCDPDGYDSYLEQLGIEYPTVRDGGSAEGSPDSDRRFMERRSPPFPGWGCGAVAAPGLSPDWGLARRRRRCAATAGAEAGI